MEMRKNQKQLINEYTLRSKDIPLIEFSLYRITEQALGSVAYRYEISINKIYEEHRDIFPKNLQKTDEKNLLLWIKKRKAPKNRRFVQKILASFADTADAKHGENPLKYVDISHALSLNDAYWITNNYTDDKWNDFNLYHHAFDEVLAYVAFTGHSKKVTGVITSPEVTSEGALKKCWSNRADGIYLIKGDDFSPSEDGRSQAINEYYAAQVAKAMGFKNIDYDVEKFTHQHLSSNKKEIVCKCKLFTNENVGFINAYTYFKFKGMNVDEADFSSILVQEKLAKLYGFEAYCDLMVFDSIIANRDRHLGNFGMMIDNNSGEILEPAPIFDNGYSLLYGAADYDLKHLDEYIKALSCRYLPLDIQAKWFVRKRHIEKLRSLVRFEFTKHEKYNITDDTLSVMNTFIQMRARKILELYKIFKADK